MNETSPNEPTAGRRKRGCPHRAARWADLTPIQRTILLTLASVEISLTATAAVDLFRRPQSRLRGRKALWWPILAVQPFGPIAYLILGRAPEESSRTPGGAPPGG